MKNVIQGEEKIVGFVVVSKCSDSDATSVGQRELGGLPQYLRDAIDQFNARPLGELDIDRAA